MERIPEMYARLERLERDMGDLQKVWRSSVDDIKAIIRSEIRELKSEQIADLRTSAKERDNKIEELEDMIRGLEKRQDRWDTSAGVVHWLIRTIFAVGGLGAGYLGAKHIG